MQNVNYGVFFDVWVNVDFDYVNSGRFIRDVLFRIPLCGAYEAVTFSFVHCICGAGKDTVLAWELASGLNLCKHDEVVVFAYNVDLGVTDIYVLSYYTRCLK